jgi:hypothetical protein
MTVSTGSTVDIFLFQAKIAFKITKTKKLVNFKLSKPIDTTI